MSYVDSFCQMVDQRHRRQCFEFSSDLQELFADLDKKGYIDSVFDRELSHVQKKRTEKVLWNMIDMTLSFNMLYDNIEDVARALPDSIGFSHLRRIIYSQEIVIFLQAVESFREHLLLFLKMPIHYTSGNQRRTVNEKTGIGGLLRALDEIGIAKSSEILSRIDYRLRNGLSHFLFWFDENMEHIYYSKDIKFQEVERISIRELHEKVTLQSIYTRCLINLVLDWFGWLRRQVYLTLCLFSELKSFCFVCVFFIFVFLLRES